jgi:hypothetical protein
MAFTELLNISAEISRRSNIGNNVEPNYVWTEITVSDGVLNQLSENKVIRDDGNRILADYILYIDYVSGILPNDRVIIGSDEFEVYRVHDPNNMNRHLEIYMLRDQPGTGTGGS